MRLREVANSRRTAASSARPSASITSFHRAASRSLSPEQTWPMVCVAKSSPPPGLSRIEPAISSCSRAQATISSPGCVSSSLGWRISMRPLFSGKRAEWLACEPVHRPLGVGFGAEALVEPDCVLVPVEHGPLEPAAAALDRHPGQTLEQRAADAATAMLGHDEEVLEVETWLREERREGVKEEGEPDRLAVVLGDERLRVASLAEQVARKPFLGHRDLVLQLLVAREAPDQVRDQGHVPQLAGPDAERHFGRSRRRKTKRIAPCVSEKLAILLSTSPASRPASMRSVSRSGPRRAREAVPPTQQPRGRAGEGEDGGRDRPPGGAGGRAPGPPQPRKPQSPGHPLPPQHRRAPRRCWAVSDLDHLQVFDRAGDRARVHVIEEEARIWMTLPQLRRRLPAHVAEDVARTGRLDNRGVGSLDQLVQWRCGLGVAGVGHDLAVDVDAISIAAHGPVVQLDALVLDPCHRAGCLRGHVADLELGPHDPVPVGSPADLPQFLEVPLDAGRADESERTPVDENAMQHEGRQAESVVAVKMGDEDDLDVAWVDSKTMHVRQERRAAVQEHAAIDHHGPVVAVQRERRAAAEERELYAMVTAGLRYTSWIACSNSMPSFIGR